MKNRLVGEKDSTPRECLASSIVLYRKDIKSLTLTRLEGVSDVLREYLLTKTNDHLDILVLSVIAVINFHSFHPCYRSIH